MSKPYLTRSDAAISLYVRPSTVSTITTVKPSLYSNESDDMCGNRSSWSHSEILAYLPAHLHHLDVDARADIIQLINTHPTDTPSRTTVLSFPGVDAHCVN